MNSKQLNELLAGENHSTAIAELKNGRNATEPNAAEYIAQLDPKGHDVNDPVKRRDKKVKVDLSDFDINDEEKKNIKTVTNGDGETENFRIEPVARVALAIQKLIVKRAVAFTFGNPVTLNAEPEEGTKEADVLKAVKRVLFDTKSRTLNRKVARAIYSSTEAAELWYPVEKPTKNYGFDSTHKLRVAIFSPLFGDRLYPYFDETGDMVAFSREYVVKDSAGVEHTYFETYTDTEIRKWTLTSNQWQLLDGYPKKNQIGKIPVIYCRQPAVEWEDVQNLIDRRYQRLPRKPENLYYGDYFGLGQEGRKRGRYRGRRRGDRAISKLGTSPRKREIRDRNPFAYDLYHYANAGYCFRFSKGYRGCFGCRLETFVYGRAPKSTGQMRGVRRLFAASIKRNTGVFSTNERQG